MGCAYEIYDDAKLDEPLMRDDPPGERDDRHMRMRLDLEQIAHGAHDKAVYQ